MISYYPLTLWSHWLHILIRLNIVIFYRPRTQYVFTQKSLRLILEKAGFECEIKLDQMTSLINHFYWLHLGKPQDSKNQMVSVTFPRPLLRNDTPFGG